MLVEHAIRELKLCGQFDEDPAYAQSIVAAVAAFASFGNSGGSHGCAVAQFTTLLNYGVLSPLTADSEEWMEVGTGTWQSQRNPQAFSEDGGKTYYILDEVDAARSAAAAAVEKPMHTAEPVKSSGRHGAERSVNTVAAAPVKVSR
jgi:hypothetical protein